jgi:germination protein M
MSVTLARSAVRPLAIGLAILLIAACTPNVGSGGPVVPRPTDGGTIAPATPEPTDPTATPSPPTDAPPTAAPATGTPGPGATPRPSVTPSGATAVRIYLFSGETLVPIVRPIERTRAVGRAALEELLAGPTGAERDGPMRLGSAIPGGTLLLGLDIADGLATVDLSREFESGGGSASMFGRLAQVVYTLTQFPTVDRVAFRLDGRPVTVFSGEGIVLDGPSTREDYTSFLPPVFVDTPGVGGVLGNPARLTGMANVFEAAFMVEIRDRNGNTLARQPAMATCGTGCWGTFDVTVRYDVSERQVGSLLVYTHSAQDGSVQDLRSYPVTLVP